MKTQIAFLLVTLALLVGCQKKEEKPAPRCIYDQSVFAEVSVKAASDEEEFLHFKRNPFFNLLWENLTREEGQAWLQKIQSQYPALIEQLDRFRENDSIGSPRVYSFGEAGLFSPSTLRLIAIAGDLKQKNGDLSPLNIALIGANHGAFCKILHELSSFKSFTIVDLPEQLALARKCLEKWGIDNVTFITPEELPKNAMYDLAISDMSFSEFNRSYQEMIFDRVFSCSRSGYLLGRVFPKHFGVVAWNASELKLRFEKMGKFVTWQMEEPAIDRENYFIYWQK